MDNKTLEIRGRFTSITFETKFLSDLKTLIERFSESSAPTEVSIDLNNLAWIDLSEALSLPITADWIVRAVPLSTPIFIIYTPSVLLKEERFRNKINFCIETARRALADRTKGKGRKYNMMRENVFHWGLWAWKLLHFLRAKRLGLYLLLENERYSWNDTLFTENSVSLERTDPEKVLEITPILEAKDLPPVRERIEIALKKHFSDSVLGEAVNFSHLIHRLCENICDHAYDVEDSLPKTGAVAVRHLMPKGLVSKVDLRVKKSTMTLRKAQQQVFTDLQIPERLHNFYGRYYDSPIFEIVVVDGGRGVYERLKPIYRTTHHGDEGTQFGVLRYAFEKGTSSKIINGDAHPSDKELGLGLFKVKDQTLLWDGVIEMRSCRSRITFSRDYKEGLPPNPDNPSEEIEYFPGTQIRVLIPEKGLGQLRLF